MLIIEESESKRLIEAEAEAARTANTAGGFIVLLKKDSVESPEN